MDCVLCRYGEIALKGNNRNLFERRLVQNMHDCLKRNGIKGDVKRTRGRIFVFTKDEKALECLKNVFGLLSLSPAIITESSIEKIKSATIEYVSSICKKKKIRSFRITSRRSDKGFPMSSQELAVVIGEAVMNGCKLKVDLHNAELDMNVEVHDTTFLFHEQIDCFGGLPLGMGGNVVCQVDTKNDILASWLIMRRSCRIFPVAKKEVDLSLLQKYDYGASVSLAKIDDIIDVNGIIDKNKCKAFVAGDTLDDFNPAKYDSIKSIVLYPLISYDDKQISDLFVRIR